MMSNYVIPEVSLLKLACFKCKKPLSHFPIYISNCGSSSSCGRCGMPQNGSFRCEIFEELAKNVKFPCCYKQNGCQEMVFPKNVANHELHCKFQTFTCPFSCISKWKGFAHDLLEHTKCEHPTSVVTDDCCFKIDFIHTCDDIKLMPYLDRLYLIESSWLGYQTISYTVKQFGYETVDDNLNYKIMFEDGEKQFNHTVFVDLNTTFQINKIILDYLLKNPVTVLASVEILQKQPVDVSVKKNVNAELLRHFECIFEIFHTHDKAWNQWGNNTVIRTLSYLISELTYDHVCDTLEKMDINVCTEYMIGPIYLCLKGHSICKPCKKQVTECPLCRSQIQTARNYTLEGLVSDFEFPCKFDNCLFVGKGTVMKKHQKTCHFIERAKN